MDREVKNARRTRPRDRGPRNVYAQTVSVQTLLMLLVWVPVLGQTPANKSEGAAKKDYSEKAAVIEQYSLKIQFENDGSSKQEQYQRVRVQSEAGVQRYGLLTSHTRVEQACLRWSMYECVRPTGRWWRLGPTACKTWQL